MIDLPSPGHSPQPTGGGTRDPSVTGEWVDTTVLKPMNDHGGMVVTTERGVTLHLVEYVSEHVADLLAALVPGDPVTLRVVRLEGRGSCFRTTGAVVPASTDPKA